MPNWCSNYWVVCGDKAELTDLYNSIKELENMDKPLVENGFGKLWLGCLVSKLGGNWEKTYCRGEIISYCWSDDNPELLCINMESAWSEPTEFRRFILNHYPGISITFAAEECGMDYYVTNDSEGTTFERYYLDASEEPLYFATLEEACRYISELTGIEVKTVCEINKALERYREGLSDDEWIYFHEFELIED